MKCKCGKEAVVYLRYSNMLLCKKHFFQLFEKRVKKAIRDFNMINKGDHIAIAYSGGKDSLALLHILNKLKKKYMFKLSLITIIEGIEGYRDNPNQFEEHLKSLGLPYYIVELKKEAYAIDEFPKRGLPACTYCALFRRYYLNKKALEIGATKLALGHNLDDAIQTFLVSIARGDNARLKRFLFPKPTKNFVTRIKPLIYIPEREVALYAILKGLSPVSGECPYAKKSLRYQIKRYINKLEDQFPGTKFKMLSSFINIAKHLKNDDINIKLCRKCHMPSSTEVCLVCQLKELGLENLNKMQKKHLMH